MNERLAMTVPRLLPVVGAFALAAASLTAQQPTPPATKDDAQSFRFRSAVELVNVTATVSDSSGRFVSNLRREDFRIFEDGQEQPVTHFSSERVPVSLGIALDTSNSMDGEKMSAARDALSRFLFDLLDPEDEVFLYRFSNVPELVEGWTTNRQRLQSRLGRLTPNGGTAMYDAVAEAVPLAQTGRYRKKALLIISDGNDTNSEATVAEVKRQIRESEVMVYAIGIDGPSSTRSVGQGGARPPTRQPPAGGGVDQDHEQLAGRVLGQQAWPACRPCTTARRRRSRSRLASRPVDVGDGRLDHRRGGRRRARSARVPTFCQGTLFTTSSTRSSRELVAHVDGRHQVADVRRVERAPEDAEALTRALPLARHPGNLCARTQGLRGRVAVTCVTARTGIPVRPGALCEISPMADGGNSLPWGRCAAVPIVEEIAMTDSVGQYLNEIGLVPLLTATEERELSQAVEAGVKARAAIEAGDDTPENRRLARKGAEAKDRFIRANLRLVVSVARRYPLPPAMELLDLIQEGNLGLEHAVDKFDWRKGFKFSTYATFWIRQAIGRALDQKASLVRLPGRPLRQPPRRAAPGVRRRRRARRRERPPLPAHHADQPRPHRRRRRRQRAHRPHRRRQARPRGRCSSHAEEQALVGDLLGVLDDRARSAVEQRFGLTDGRKRSYREVGEDARRHRRGRPTAREASRDRRP